MLVSKLIRLKDQFGCAAVAYVTGTYTLWYRLCMIVGNNPGTHAMIIKIHHFKRWDNSWCDLPQR